MILEIYRYLPSALIPKGFPEVDYEELLRLKVQANYVAEMECLNMQKAVAKALGAE